MLTWQYPEFIAVGAVMAVLIVWFILRSAQGGPRAPTFSCEVCGRKQAGLVAKEWRYCPWCGVPKGGSLRELPRKKSVLDLPP